MTRCAVKMISLEKHIALEYKRRYGDITIKHRDRAKRLKYIKRILSRECIRCGSVRYVDHTLCLKCYTKEKERHKKDYVNRKKDDTVCNRCGGSMIEDHNKGKFDCSDCNEDSRERKAGL